MKVYALMRENVATRARCSEMDEECEHVSGNSI
jgi:hypothetical protein